MIVHRPLLKAVTGLPAYKRVSRYKSLYCRLSESEHSNLVGLATELYHQDKVKYDVCQPPLSSLEDVTLSKDWEETHDCTVMYGSPELADHLSGHIYMRATMYEDKCSQAYRLADLVPEFDNPQIISCIGQCTQWPLKTVTDSETLQRIVKAIDAESYKRCQNGEWDDSAQMQRAAFLISCNLLKLKESKILRHVIAHASNAPGDPVVHMLFSAFNNQSLPEGPSIAQNVQRVVQDRLEDMSSSELAVLYSGLRALLHDATVLKSLKDKIESRYGFRLT